MNDTETRIPEIDMWEFDAELYKAWKLIEKQDYGRARVKIAALWYEVHTFNLSEPEQDLPSTHDTHFIALILKSLYWFLNLYPRRCRKHGYWCEWVYPYGFVPQGGCSIHD